MLHLAVERFDYWTELSGRHLDLTDPDVVRVNAIDLRHAQRIRAGYGPDVTVLLDVEVVIDTDGSRARRRFAELVRRPGVSYAGTPAGLAGLIADIHAAGVADGVTLLPKDEQSMEHIAQHTVPWLEARLIAS